MQRMMACSSSSSGGGVGSFFLALLPFPPRFGGVGTSSGSRALLCWPLVALPDRRVLSVEREN